MALEKKSQTQGETPHLGRDGGFHSYLLPIILRLRVPNPHAYPVGAARRRVPHVQPRRCGVPCGAAAAALAVASGEGGVGGQRHPLRRRVGPLRRGAQLRPRGGGSGGRSRWGSEREGRGRRVAATAAGGRGRRCRQVANGRRRPRGRGRRRRRGDASHRRRRQGTSAEVQCGTVGGRRRRVLGFDSKPKFRDGSINKRQRRGPIEKLSPNRE